MKFEIFNRWTREVQVTAEISCDENTSYGMKLGLAVKWALASDSDLRGSDLSGSDLSGSDLSGSNLSGSNLRGSDLRDSDLSGSNLRGSDLSGSNLSGSDLSGSNLRGSNLRGSNLRDSKLNHIRADFFDVLLHAPHEIEGLATALREGRVNGSTYEGECCCLVGTIANVKHCKYDEVPNLAPDSDRPAERWFLGIRQGDKPETNQIVAITLEWIAEFQELLTSAKA